jgi:hypothetical protein
MKDKMAIAIGCVAIILFAITVFYLFTHSNPGEINDSHWERLLYVFTTVETVGFAALSFFFGSKVNRERAEQAEETAEQNAELVKKAMKILGGVEGKVSGISAAIEKRKTDMESRGVVELTYRDLDELQESIDSIKDGLNL